MTKFNKIKSLLFMMSNLNRGYNDLLDYDEIKYRSNKKISDIQFKLYVLTLRVMIDEISEKELKEEIDKLNDLIYEKLSVDEISFIKNDFQKTLNTRKEL